MNALTNLLEKKRQNLLSVYFTAGYPHKDSTTEIISSLQDAGVDFLEAGFPFSDPLADGPVIQQTSQQAITNGMTLDCLLLQIEKARAGITIPIVLMGYLNPVMQTGMENFCRKANKAGISGVIIPDLPPDQYEARYLDLFKSYDLHMIFLVTPETSEQRIRNIDRLGSGFIYAVSSSSTTGRQDSFSDRQKQYLRRLQKMNLRNPVITGFGIHSRNTLRTAWENSSGAIIGSAYLKALMREGSGQKAITQLFGQLGLAGPV